jgi:hypothetical protein
MIVSDNRPDLDARAKMTSIQCHSLAIRLNHDQILSELQSLAYLQRIRLSSQACEGEISRWMLNGWNTEHLLHVNSQLLSGDAISSSLHWAFPQAYYSVFALTSAFFLATGNPQNTHTGMIREVGTLMNQDKYPPSISFLAGGGSNGNRSYSNINSRILQHTLEFSAGDEQCVDTQIAQFLNSTRKYQLASEGPPVKPEASNM